MKKLLAVAVGSIFLFAAGMPLAQDAKAPMAGPGAMAPNAGSSMNMGGAKAPMAAPGTMAPNTGASMNMGSAMAQMDEHMQLMKALHEKTMSATTPEARKILMDRQREEMQSTMAMMNQMQGGAMMGGMGGGMMTQKGKPVDPKSQMQVMEKRMGVMEMMMQTMLDQQGMMAGPQGGMPK